MENVLVTGGAGFIGSHLIDYLVEKGYKVGIIDNFSYGRKSNISKINEVQIFECDILDNEKLENIISEFQPVTIYHLAALHHIPTCENMPTTALKINIQGTQNILNAAKSIDKLQKIIFASSGAVYDIIDEPLIEGETPTVPYDIYSVSKLSGEYLMRLWAKKFGKKAYVGRIFNTIGARETNDHLVPDIITQILKGKNEIELGNLEPKRTYIDVRDTARGLLSIGELESNSNYDIFNIGREDEFNVQEILDFLAEVSAKKIVATQNPSRMRKVDRKKQLACINKIFVETGWSPKYTVRDGLKYAYQSYLKI